MKLNNLIEEVKIIEMIDLAILLYEKEDDIDLNEGKKGVNVIVQDWAEKYNLPYDKVHKIWERAEKIAGKGNYPLIVHIFKRIFTSLINVDARTIKSKTGGKFDYHVRTKQPLELAVVDAKPKLQLEHTKNQIKKINKKIKQLKEQIKKLKSKNKTEYRIKKINQLKKEIDKLEKKKEKLHKREEKLIKKIKEKAKKILSSKKK